MNRFMSLIFVFLCFSLVFASSLRAEKPTQKWLIGPEISHLTSKIPEQNREDKGLIYGIMGSYTYMSERVVFKGEAKAGYGSLKYESGGVTDYTPNYMHELRVSVGYKPSGPFIPYIGIGYRYLNLHVYGYEKESTYFYTPLGIEAVKRLNSWSIGATAEYDHFWQGLQHNHLSDIGGSDVKFRQKK